MKNINEYIEQSSMLSQSEYIQESLDTENLFWKLNTWFSNSKDIKEEFKLFIDKCRLDNSLLNGGNLASTLDNIGVNVSNLVDFLEDYIGPTNERDYEYLMKKIIETIISNKSYENTFAMD